MMLDINFAELREGFLQYLPIGALIGLILLAELLVVVGGWVITPDVAMKGAAPIPSPEILPNTHALGELIYTHYIYLFQASGIILLVAMIGAIVLTFRRRAGVHRQKISDQLNRHPEDTIEIHQIKPGQGI
jgi:NADH-quinone oxidoreductase subunit J